MQFSPFALSWHTAFSQPRCNLTIGSEYPPADEPMSIAAVTNVFMAQGKAQEPKEIVRGAHAKTNACARATWKVDDAWATKDPSLTGLDIGVFSEGGVHTHTHTYVSNESRLNS